MAWENLCIHRGSRLSLGSIENGILKCAYHGWEYDESAQCTKIPSQTDIKIPKKACVKNYKVIEKMGLLWINISENQNKFINIKEFADSNFKYVRKWTLLYECVCTKNNGKLSRCSSLSFCS